MRLLAVVRRPGRAATVFCGDHGAVGQLARPRQVSRPTLDRAADAARHDLDGTAARQPLQDLHHQRERLHGRVRQLQALLRQAVGIDTDRPARCARTAQAEGVRRPVARRLLRGRQGPRTPRGARPRWGG